MGIGDGSMAQPRKLLTTFMDGGHIFSFDREGCQVMIEGTGNRECRALCKLKTPFVDSCMIVITGVYSCMIVITGVYSCMIVMIKLGVLKC
jgi:hypothetical protein